MQQIDIGMTEQLAIREPFTPQAARENMLISLAVVKYIIKIKQAWYNLSCKQCALNKEYIVPSTLI